MGPDARHALEACHDCWHPSGTEQTLPALSPQQPSSPATILQEPRAGSP